MIQGVYEKNGEHTVIVGNGLIEIEPVPSKVTYLHAITGSLKAKKRVPRRKVESFTPAQAVFSGVAWGMPMGILICTALSADGALRWWSIASMAVAGFWVHQNYWRKR